MTSGLSVSENQSDGDLMVMQYEGLYYAVTPEIDYPSVIGVVAVGSAYLFWLLKKSSLAITDTAI